MMEQLFSKFSLKLTILILLTVIVSRLHSKQCSRTWNYEIVNSGWYHISFLEHSLQVCMLIYCITLYVLAQCILLYIIYQKTAA